jgi:hypothetical protein
MKVELFGRSLIESGESSQPSNHVSPKTARAIAKLATLGSGHSMSKENFFGGIKIIEVAGIKSPSEA